MNIAGKSNNELLFINFNQDYGYISVGTKYGYKLFYCDPFSKNYSRAEGGIGLVEMLFSTSLVALVGAGEQPAFSPRKLKIVNTKRDTTICELNFPTTVLSVKLNRRRMAIVLEEQIYIYDISNMRLQHTLETSPNPKAICALSPSNENCYLAYPALQPPSGSPFSAGAESTGSTGVGSPKGEVLVYDALSLQVINVIQAHKSGLSFLSINPSGTMLATASDKGTVIRVFSLPGAQKLYQFRRGTYAARIYSISFNMVSSLLCVSSDTDTVHIFRLGNTGKGSGYSRSYPDDASSSATLRRTSFQSLVGRKLVGSMGGYLPEALTEMWEPARDFAFLKLPSVGAQSIVALSSTTPQVMVVTSDGYLYQYNIDLENGGECVLLKQYCLLESSDDLGTGMLID